MVRYIKSLSDGEVKMIETYCFSYFDKWNKPLVGRAQASLIGKYIPRGT